MITPDTTPGASRKTRILARLFDIRNIIAALIGIYGVLLVLAGLMPDAFGAREHQPRDANRVDMAAGTDANTWVGLIMVVVAAVFVIWALWRPLVSDADADGEQKATMS